MLRAVRNVFPTASVKLRQTICKGVRVLGIGPVNRLHCSHLDLLVPLVQYLKRAEEI